jgi:hypothetical protein
VGGAAGDRGSLKERKKEEGRIKKHAGGDWKFHAETQERRSKEDAIES